MRYLEEYRERELILRLAEQVRASVTRPWRMMEICGGQTHSILRAGLQQLLPPELDLIHGPGCPVCVTPEERIDQAIALASDGNSILCTFGDMLRVPGSKQSLLGARAQGARVQMVTSPLEALELARRMPQHRVVFFAVGFETTAPTTAVAVRHAMASSLRNFSVLVAHVRVPPALETLLEEPDNAIDGLLAAGHVCSIMGTLEYTPLTQRYRVPIIVTGFEPVDILQGILACVRLLERGEHGLANHYARAVQVCGNPVAQSLVNDVFEVTDLPWRGMGMIPQGGLRLRPRFAEHDASLAFDAIGPSRASNGRCISGLVLAGKKRPLECPAFGTDCTPSHPLGAPMVSSEGACAAYFKHAHLALGVDA